MNSISLHRYTTFFVLITEPLSSFHILATMNSAAMNFDVHIFAWTYVFISLGHMPKSEISQSWVTPYLTFWKPARLFSVEAVTYCIPTTVYEGYNFSTFLSTLTIVCHFDSSHSSRYEMLYCSFGLHFLMINDVEHILICLRVICISSLEKCIFKSFAHFFNW